MFLCYIIIVINFILLNFVIYIFLICLLGETLIPWSILCSSIELI